MKLKINQRELIEVLNNIIRAVPAKSTISALTGIFISVKNEKVTLTGYDMDLGITKEIECEADEAFDFVVESKLFTEIIRKMDSDNLTISTTNKNEIQIKGYKASYKIPYLSADEYPSIPAPDTNNPIVMTQGCLKNMISQTIYAVATTDNRPILTGELFDIEDNNINVVAIDGYRIAMRSEKIDNEGKYYFVVKAKTLNEVSKLLTDKEIVVESEDSEKKNVEELKANIYVTKKFVHFDVNGYMVYSRLLEGDFHDYKKSLPKSFTTEVKINTRQFTNAIERCMPLINEKVKTPIKCTFENDEVKIFCSTPLGELDDCVEATISGDKVEIGFNARLLLDALKSADTDMIRLELTSSLAPMTIKPLDDESFIFLVLPVRYR